MSQHATQQWPCDRRSIAEVRGFVAAQCQLWQLDAASDDLVLMASEMATNAVTHARSPFQLSMSVRNDQVLLEVSDDNGQLPAAPALPWRSTSVMGAVDHQLDDVDFLLGPSSTPKACPAAA